MDDSDEHPALPNDANVMGHTRDVGAIKQCNRCTVNKRAATLYVADIMQHACMH
jgi:hypothetical protein